MAEQPFKSGGGGGKKPAPPPGGGGLKFPELIIIFVAAIILIPIVGTLFSSPSTQATVFSVLGTIYADAKLIATIISMLALAVVVFSFIRISELSAEETKKLGLELSWNSEKKQKNARWERVEQYMTSLNPSDWKIAILEADNMLDEITERMGYKGETLGERMKEIQASDFPYLDEAWQVHKLRNAIAHKGTDYALSRSDAEQAINVYHRVFKSQGYL